ncbi:MAG: type II toxin-antitoxin system VapC family toxin [Alphaproteobacteria bacterium]|nr:type II toxin-antitoxin system VapC family toxin [Alphaproteobacteria bacterium]
MVIDSSAIVALLNKEPEAEDIAAKIADAKLRTMAAPSVFETYIVAEKRWGVEGAAFVTRFLHETRTDIRPFGRELIHQAQLAWRDYGKGRHPAALNFGDRMAYSLAKFLDLPLLFKGTDFARTDIRRA